MPRLEPSDEEEQHEGGVGGVKSKKKKRSESTRDINREARRRGGRGGGEQRVRRRWKRQRAAVHGDGEGWGPRGVAFSRGSGCRAGSGVGPAGPGDVRRWGVGEIANRRWRAHRRAAEAIRCVVGSFLSSSFLLFSTFVF